MKKILALVLAVVCVLSFAACGKTSSTATTAANTATTAAATQAPTAANVPETNPVGGVFFPATSSATGAYATIKVSADIQFDDESAWLGLCPAGKDYITEIEADEVDVIWFHADGRESEKDPHVFACDFSTVEDGTYALVVTSSDDENVGYVIIQLEMTKKGESLSFNFADAKLNERP